MSVINLSEYLTVGMIAKGQNTVIRVKSIYTQKEYALKKIRRADFDKHLIDLQELLHLMNCSHLNIIKILGFTICQQKVDSYRNEYILCILMDIMDKTLERDVKDRSITQAFYSKDEILKLTKDLISALHYMQNEIKLAHRDIKPENILIGKDGTILLSDFSESFLENEIKKCSTTLVGSPYYMAPELREIYVQGEFGDRPEYNPWKADVYSLGMTILDCAILTIGEKKSKKEKYEVLENLYGKEFKDLIELCLNEEVDKRPDFLEFVNCEEYHKIFGNFEMELSQKKENGKNKENSTLAHEFLELIESLKEEIKEEHLNREEALAIFQEIQFLEQERSILSENKEKKEGKKGVLNIIESINENKNCPQQDFEKATSPSENKEKISEVFTPNFQNGNTQ